MRSLAFPEAVMILVIAFVLILPCWRICAKAGFPGWLGVLVVAPGLNLFLAYFLAFARWPAERR